MNKRQKFARNYLRQQTNIDKRKPIAPPADDQAKAPSADRCPSCDGYSDRNPSDDDYCDTCQGSGTAR